MTHQGVKMCERLGRGPGRGVWLPFVGANLQAQLAGLMGANWSHFDTCLESKPVDCCWWEVWESFVPANRPI